MPSARERSTEAIRQAIDRLVLRRAEAIGPRAAEQRPVRVGQQDRGAAAPVGGGRQGVAAQEQAGEHSSDERGQDAGACLAHGPSTRLVEAAAEEHLAAGAVDDPHGFGRLADPLRHPGAGEQAQRPLLGALQPAARTEIRVWTSPGSGPRTSMWKVSRTPGALCPNSVGASSKPPPECAIGGG